MFRITWNLRLLLSDDGELFMTIFDRSDLQLLKDWMEHTRFMREGVG